MKKPNNRILQKVATLTGASLLMFVSNSATAASGSWSVDTDGNWGDSANWLGSIIADGAGNTARFTNDISGIRTVTLDTARTIGGLEFTDGDSMTTPEAGWILAGSTLTLTNSGGTPVINAHDLANTSMLNDARITASISSEQGFIKKGTNTLTLTAVNNFPTPVQVEQGLVAVGNVSALGTNNQTVVLNGGGVAVTAGVAYGNTNNVTGTGTLWNLAGGNYDSLNGPWIGSASSVMNIYSASRFTLNAGNANQLKNFLGTICLSNSPSGCLFRINAGGSPNDMSPNVLDTGTGSGRFACRITAAKGIWKIGAIQGAGGQLCGSENSGGTMTTNEVGYLNTDTTFGGVIRAYGSGREVSLTKVGTGRLTLTGSSTYIGNTTIDNGVLALSGSGTLTASPLINIMASGKLDVSGQTLGTWSPLGSQTVSGVGAVVGNVGVLQGTIAPGVGAVGTLTFSNNLSLGGSYVSTNLFKVGAGGNDKILVGGDLTVSEMVIIRVVPTGVVIPNGTYTLLKCSGTLTADLANMTLEYPAQTGTLALGINSGTKEIYLSVTGVSSAANLTWMGDLSADWDLATSNWRNGATPSVFTTGDNVTFNNTSSTTNVNLAIDASPGSVTVNSTKDYLFDNGGGTGKITGMTSLVKSNTGSLTLVTDNDYAGATMIHGGNVIVGDGINYRGRFGSGAITNNASVTYNRPDDLAVSDTFYGTGKVVKIGYNTITMAGVNNCTGGTTISNGVVAINSYGALGTNPVVMAGGQLTIYPAGGAGSGLAGQINVVDNSTIQYAANGTYACVFTGPLNGTVGKVLTLTPTSASTSRVRVYGAFTYNADLVLNAGSLNLAPYQSSGQQIYNGVVSGPGLVLIRCNGGDAIFNNANSVYSGGTFLSQGSVGVGADSISSGGVVTSGPLGTGPIISTTESGTNGSCALFASGGARIIENPIGYDTGTNWTTILFGGSHDLTLSGAMTLYGNNGDTTIVERTLNVTNTGVTTLSGVISDGGYAGSITKTGNGVLRLTAVNTYTGPTVVQAGALAGTGTIAGPVTVQSGGTLAPGAASIGTLTINNTLTLASGSTTSVRVNKTAGTRDQVAGLTSVVYGGTLVVSNLAGTLTTSDSFKIFNASSYSGAFTSVTPAPGAGLAWDTSTLATDGTLRVKTAGPPPQPKINNVAVDSGKLVFSGTNGTPGAGYSVLSSTNVALAVASWTVDSTGTFDSTGAFRCTNAISPSIPAKFFMLRVP